MFLMMDANYVVFEITSPSAFIQISEGQPGCGGTLGYRERVQGVTWKVVLHSSRRESVDNWGNKLLFFFQIFRVRTIWKDEQNSNVNQLNNEKVLTCHYFVQHFCKNTKLITPIKNLTQNNSPFVIEEVSSENILKFYKIIFLIGKKSVMGLQQFLSGSFC